MRRLIEDRAYSSKYGTLVSRPYCLLHCRICILITLHCGISIFIFFFLFFYLDGIVSLRAENPLVKQVQTSVQETMEFIHHGRRSCEVALPCEHISVRKKLQRKY